MTTPRTFDSLAEFEQAALELWQREGWAAEIDLHLASQDGGCPVRFSEYVNLSLAPSERRTRLAAFSEQPEWYLQPPEFQRLIEPPGNGDSGLRIRLIAGQGGIPVWNLTAPDCGLYLSELDLEDLIAQLTSG